MTPTEAARARLREALSVVPAKVRSGSVGTVVKFKDWAAKARRDLERKNTTVENLTKHIISYREFEA